MNEYFQGTRTILHDDGSSTHITYEHEPQFEPLTKKEAVVIYGGTLLAVGVCAAGPMFVMKGIDWIDDKRQIRTRQKLNKKLFLQLKKN